MKKYHLLILILAMIFGLTLINNTDASAHTPTRPLYFCMDIQGRIVQRMA